MKSHQQHLNELHCVLYILIVLLIVC